MTVTPSITYLPSELVESEWTELVTVPQLETEQKELQEARKVARMAREFYTFTRIVKSTLNGSMEVVK